MEPEAAVQELKQLRTQLQHEQRSQARLCVQYRKQATELRKAQNVLFAYEAMLFHEARTTKPSDVTISHVIASLRSQIVQLEKQQTLANDTKGSIPLAIPGGSPSAKASPRTRDNKSSNLNQGEGMLSQARIKYAEDIVSTHMSSLLPQNYELLSFSKQKSASLPAIQFVKQHVRRLQHNLLKLLSPSLPDSNPERAPWPNSHPDGQATPAPKDDNKPRSAKPHLKSAATSKRPASAHQLRLKDHKSRTPNKSRKHHTHRPVSAQPRRTRTLTDRSPRPGTQHQDMHSVGPESDRSSFGSEVRSMSPPGNREGQVRESQDHVVNNKPTKKRSGRSRKYHSSCSRRQRPVSAPVRRGSARETDHEFEFEHFDVDVGRIVGAHEGEMEPGIDSEDSSDNGFETPDTQRHEALPARRSETMQESVEGSAVDRQNSAGKGTDQTFLAPGNETGSTGGSTDKHGSGGGSTDIQALDQLPRARSRDQEMETSAVGISDQIHTDGSPPAPVEGQFIASTHGRAAQLPAEGADIHALPPPPPPSRQQQSTASTYGGIEQFRKLSPGPEAPSPAPFEDQSTGSTHGSTEQFLPQGTVDPPAPAPETEVSSSTTAIVARFSISVHDLNEHGNEEHNENVPASAGSGDREREANQDPTNQEGNTRQKVSDGLHPQGIMTEDAVVPVGINQADVSTTKEASSNEDPTQGSIRAGKCEHAVTQGCSIVYDPTTTSLETPELDAEKCQSVAIKQQPVQDAVPVSQHTESVLQPVPVQHDIPALQQTDSVPAPQKQPEAAAHHSERALQQSACHQEQSNGRNHDGTLPGPSLLVERLVETEQQMTVTEGERQQVSVQSLVQDSVVVQQAGQLHASQEWQASDPQLAPEQLKNDQQSLAPQQPILQNQEIASNSSVPPSADSSTQNSPPPWNPSHGIPFATGTKPDSSNHLNPWNPSKCNTVASDPFIPVTSSSAALPLVASCADHIQAPESAAIVGPFGCSLGFMQLSAAPWSQHQGSTVLASQPIHNSAVVSGANGRTAVAQSAAAQAVNTSTTIHDLRATTRTARTAKQYVRRTSPKDHTTALGQLLQSRDATYQSLEKYSPYFSSTEHTASAHLASTQFIEASSVLSGTQIHHQELHSGRKLQKQSQ